MSYHALFASAVYAVALFEAAETGIAVISIDINNITKIFLITYPSQIIVAL